MRKGVCGECRGVMRDAHYDRASVGQHIIDAVGDGDAGGIGAEVVIVDQTGGQFPACAGIAKVADQFPFFGVHADDGQAVALERLAQIGEVEKLLVAMRAEVGGKLLVIDTQRISHLVEEPSDRIGADDDSEIRQRHGNLFGSAAGPFQASNGIPGRVVFE